MDDFWEAFFLFLIFVPIGIVWVFSVVDIFRRDDIGGFAKAIWLLVVIFAPLFGTLFYLIFRKPGATSEERVMIEQANKDFVARYSPTDQSEQLRVLADLHDRGKLTDDEFAAEKARVLGKPAAPASAGGGTTA